MPSTQHRVSLAIALALFVLPYFATATDWPTWRGPGRDGHVRDFQPPEPWPETLTRLWSLEVGEGHASPVVSGERVFVHSREQGSEVVRAIDLASGKVLWRQAYPVEFRPADGVGRHGNSPKATPAVADGRLFTLSIDGQLTAWDANSGKRLWRRNSLDYKARAPLWGHAGSPLVDGERVIVHLGGHENGSLMALDAATGKTVWRYGEAGPAYASAVLAEIGGTPQIVTQDETGILGLDASDGRRLWHFSFPQTYYNQNSITPVVDGDTLFVAGEDRGVFALRVGRGPDGWTVRRLWRNGTYSPDMSSPVLVEGVLVGLGYERRGTLFALDPTDGKVIWKSPGRAGSYAALLAIPGYVLAQTDEAEVLLLDAAGGTFSLVKSYQVARSPTWAHPVLLQNGLLVKDSRSLARWSFSPSDR